ncbi:hypothetical protein ACTU3I_16885 [Microbacterium sp. RD1]|uniref:hypothetical protein n=1 Tax=Microbacterium sp. RD1 TaxID=3457313 RepID=UPI003FA52CD9
MRTPRRLAFSIVLVAATTLVACAFVPETRVTRLPTDNPRTTASASPSVTETPASPTPAVRTTAPVPQPEPVADCGGQPIVLDASSPTWTISGTCPDVQIHGSELVIDAEQADAGVVVVAGDRISVRMGAAGSVTVQGNDVFVDADGISSLTIRGDRNTIETRSGVGGVLLQGNDNVVRGSVGQVADEGERNAVG